jgi:hypothetical protein
VVVAQRFHQEQQRDAEREGEKVNETGEQLLVSLHIENQVGRANVNEIASGEPDVFNSPMTGCGLW